MSNIKRTILIVLSVVFLLASVALIVIATIDYNNRLINNISIDINYPNNKQVLTKETVKKAICHEVEFLTNSKVKYFNDSIILKKITEINYVDTAYIACGIKGDLHINVLQKEPIAVLQKGVDKLFITSDTNLISYTDFANNNLPVFHLDSTINISNKSELKILESIKGLCRLSAFFDKPSFIKESLDSIFIDKENQLVLKTIYGDQDIYLGDAKKMEEKSQNLECFYLAFNRDTLEKYKSLNLSFDNQIVAVKK